MNRQPYLLPTECEPRCNLRLFVTPNFKPIQIEYKLEWDFRIHEKMKMKIKNKTLQNPKFHLNNIQTIIHGLQRRKNTKSRLQRTSANLSNSSGKLTSVSSSVMLRLFAKSWMSSAARSMEPQRRRQARYCDAERTRGSSPNWNWKWMAKLLPVFGEFEPRVCEKYTSKTM